jgi:hypothetical protein
MTYDEAIDAYTEKFGEPPPTVPPLRDSPGFVSLLKRAIKSGETLTEETIDAELGEQPWEW